MACGDAPVIAGLSCTKGVAQLLDWTGDFALTEQPFLVTVTPLLCSHLAAKPVNVAIRKACPEDEPSVARQDDQ